MVDRDENKKGVRPVLRRDRREMLFASSSIRKAAGEVCMYGEEGTIQWLRAQR